MSLREVVEAANARDTDWSGVYAVSYVSRRLTGQDDDGFRDAAFIAAVDPPMVLALLDVVEEARRTVQVINYARTGAPEIPVDPWTDVEKPLREALARLPEEVRQ